MGIRIKLGKHSHTGGRGSDTTSGSSWDVIEFIEHRTIALSPAGKRVLAIGVRCGLPRTLGPKTPKALNPILLPLPTI